jgi:RHS repeat-associated protein
MKDMTNQSALIGYWPYDELVSKVHAFKKEIKDPEDPDNPDAPAQTRYYAVLLVEYFGIRILDVTDADHPKEWAFLDLGKNENLAGLDVALDYWVDLDTEKDINDTPEMREVTAKEELKDLLFFTDPSEGKVYVVDFTNHPGAGGELNIKKTIPIADARYIGDIRLSEKDRLLYVADNNLGLVVLDMSFNGHTLDRSGDETDRVLGTIDTSGKSQFGITIDEDLNVAYVGQLEKGVDMVKLANPEVKFVYLDSETGIYHEVEKIAPMGLRERDNPADPVTGKKLPGEIYVMAVLPGDTGLKSDVEDGKFFVEAVLWGLNKYHHPIISWDDGSGVKSYFKKLKLYRQSDNPYEEKFKMFLSKPIQVTIDPVKPESGTPGGNDPIKVLSGDSLWVHLSGKVHENLANSGESNVYLTRNDCRLSGDKKPSVRADLVDRYKNLDKNEEEKPNNPAMYNSVYLHSGEFVHSGADVIIPGRGFDFAFIRTYRSQGIYSGVLGWGWDHNYHKRLLEMPGGDILYFDGTGRRERYKAQKAGSRITGYIVPEGWFTRLKKKEDGTFRLIYPDLFVEYYDEKGMLIKIKDRNDNRMEFYYDIAGQMTAVMDTMGRMIDFEYYPLEFEASDSDPGGRIKITSGRLKQITDFSGRVIKYEYNEQNGDLEKVTFAGRVTQYTYASDADLKLAHNLKTSIDPEGRTVFTVTYEDGVDKAKEQQQGDSRVAYSTGESGASVTDGRGNAKVFNIQDGHPEQISEGGYQTGFSYNDDGLVQKVTYPELNSITYGYPTAPDKTNKRSAANLEFISENPGPRGDGGSPKTPTTFSYESMTNQVKSIAYPNGLSVTNSNEDENGNFRRVETNVEGLSYQLDYNDYGQVKSETNPFGMTTSYKYFSEASPGGNESPEMGRIPDSDTGGYLETMTSDLVTRNFQEYDKRGNLQNYNDSHGTTAIYSFTDHDELQTENVASSSSMSPLVYNGTYGYYQNGLLRSRQTNFGSGDTPVSNTTTYTYTPRNMLQTETESDRGITTTYSYDQNDNLTGISNTLDSISFTYNDRDLVETVKLGSDVGGPTFTYDYDGNGNVTTAADKYGNTTAYQYDGYDRLKTIIDPLNNQTLISRLDNGNTLNIKQYDTAENMLRETVRVNDPIGRVKQYSVKMPTNNDETYSYTYAYSGEGQVITISDSLSRTWTISKNEKGQVFFQQDPAGNTIEYFYEDGRGNMTRMIETEVQADGTKKTYITHYTYNAFNKIEEIKETVGDGETIYTTFTYDERGNLTGSKDAEGNIISHRYDNFGRRIWSKRHFKSTGATITTRFEYYANDMLWKIIDDKENVTEYKYDDRKRLTRAIYPDNSEINFTYTEEIVDNKKYRVVIETQRNGTKVTGSYDGLNRLVSRISIPAGGVGGISESYDYDGLNRLTKASDNDTTVEFAYDPLNRLTEEKQQGKVIGYTYSVVNNLRKMTMTYPNGRVIEKDFDLLDRVSKIKQGQDNMADFSYVGRSYRVLGKQFGNGDAISYLYDQGRRLHQKETKNKNLDLINRYVYGYNKTHMKTYEMRGHNNNAGDVYTYDDVYRLTNVKINVPDPTVPNPTEFEKEKTFNFDKLDNIMSIVETQNEQTLTKTTQINSILNQYENFAGWGLSYDLNGNTIQKGTQHFTYDYRNQIIKAKDQTTEANYKYDALGRRIQKAVTVGSATKTTNYYYSGIDVIEERDGSDNVLNQYIYGDSIDDILRMDKYTGTSSTPYYFHTDGIGSVTAITDGNGNPVERVSYDPYGMPTFTNAAGEVVYKSTIGNTLLFHGRRYDAETNLYYYRARYYDPIMGRFLQTDPMGYEDSMNLYQGFNMNPINFLDPYGELLELAGTKTGAEQTLKLLKLAFPEDIWENIDIIEGKGESGYRKGRFYIDPVKIAKIKNTGGNINRLIRIVESPKTIQLVTSNKAIGLIKEDKTMKTSEFVWDLVFNYPEFVSLGYYLKGIWSETVGTGFGYSSERGISKAVFIKEAPTGARVYGLVHELLLHGYQEVMGEVHTTHESAHKDELKVVLEAIKNLKKNVTYDEKALKKRKLEILRKYYKKLEAYLSKEYIESEIKKAMSENDLDLFIEIER